MAQYNYRKRMSALLASSALLPVLASLIIVTAAAPARADDFTGLGFLSGGTQSSPWGISGDGTVVVGGANVASGFTHAFRWSGGVMTDLGTLGGSTSSAQAASSDGSVVVGYASTTGDGAQHAFRWSGGVMTDLGTLGGAISAAYGVSADGSVVVGASGAASNFTRAFRWAGGIMSDLGALGGSASIAYGVSANGAVVVGTANLVGDVISHAFRWTGGTMTDLGTLGGSYSTATAVSANGLVVVGTSNTAGDTASHVFRWSGGTMSDLGTLGGVNGTAAAVSADGSVVVGQSSLTGNHTTGAFRWTAATGMQNIQTVLTASGVNLTGWTLTGAMGVSADGSVITGFGGDPQGRPAGWIARFSSQFGNGLITPDVVSGSFSGVSAVGQTGNAAIDGTLGTMTEIATQGGSSQGGSQFSVFGYGGYDSDPVASGSLGMTMKLPDKMLAGAMVSANYLRTDMVYDGNSKMRGGAGGVFLARVPDVGLQWLVGASGVTLKGDITRGYLNGASLTSSQGSTTGNGFGAAGRIGWTFDRVWRATQVTPFASYTMSRTHINGYTESGGPFPAQLNGFTDTSNIVRVGADARYTFAPGTWVWGTVASAHRLSNSRADDISGTVIGVFGMTAPAAPVAKDWIETTAGVRWQVWKNGSVSASATAAIPTNALTTYQVRLGVTQTF